MDAKLQKAICEQINKEFYSAYLYLAMSAFFETKSLPGLSHWMQMQAQEELFHGMKFFNFLGDCGVAVELDKIEKPQTQFKSIKEVFALTYEHEQEVTASINDLFDLAQGVKDRAVLMFLPWFITEQVEEEKNAADICSKLEFIKEDSMGILMLDKELGARMAPSMGADTAE